MKTLTVDDQGRLLIPNAKPRQEFHCDCTRKGTIYLVSKNNQGGRRLLGSRSVDCAAADLWEELTELSAENAKLRAEVSYLRDNPSLARGLRGETLMAKLLGAQLAAPGAGHDMEAAASGLRFEIKYSGLQDNKTGYATRRWTWSKLFGESGSKKYDRVLLVGDADRQFAKQYRDHSSPYIIFDLTYEEAIELVGGMKPGRSGKIGLTTNPKALKAHLRKRLFKEFQVTDDELKVRYPTLEAVASVVTGGTVDSAFS